MTDRTAIEDLDTLLAGLPRYSLGTSFFDGPYPLARQFPNGEWVRLADVRAALTHNPQGAS